MTEPVYIDRPPRIQPELPFDVIEVPSPPDKDEGQNSRLIQVALPMVTIIGYILISTLGGSGRSPAMLLPMALSVLASVGFSIYSYRKELKRKEEIERAYSDRLVEMNKEMNNYQDMQRRFYRYNYPEVASTLRIVDNTRQEAVRDDRILRTESRLWERRTFDNDFGVVRLGMGTLPSTVLYQIKEEENFDDPQMREARKLADDSKFVNDIPIIVNFRQKLEEKKDEDDESDENVDEEQSPVTPVTHAMGIAGDKEAVYSFTRGMLLDYAVFHAPMDARLFILAKSQEQWAWTERLPHSLDDDTTTYRCFVEDAEEDEEEVRFDEDDEGIVVDFLEGIRKTLAQRKLRLSENDENNTSMADPTLPFNLLVVDLMDVGEEDGPLSDLESDAAISIILEEGSTLGAAVVFLVPERAKVPSGCHSVIEIEFTDRETGGSQPKRGLYFRYAEIGVNTHRYVGDADAIPKLEIMNQLAMMLAQMDVRQSFGANLTKVVPFLELMGFSSLDDLREQTRIKWRESIKSDNSDWLRSKIGRMSGNKARTLVFSAKRDGVHGMVAGSTGSGKSELMISMIAAMVVTYDPSILNFVLVDYKGGGAFKGFDNMPHCVDIITNLEGDAVTRMFTAITSEMQRRQKLNADTGTKNIVDYRQKGLHETHSPYPFLFIIIDEFAEMIADRPEYRSELESITRVGRAQGVSLLLAAQRPTGVTDQMRSNIKFRISLRVETPAESREMLRRNDAAFLPSNIPGRGYLQVGNEEIELIQSAYTGEKYIDPRKDHNQPVLWPDRQDIIFDAADDQEPPILYKAIVDLLEELSNEENRPKQRAPWPDFLSHHLTLSELLISPDPRAEAITSVEYLASEDYITLGREAEAVLTLNPSVNKWDNGENGWYEDDLDWGQYGMRPVVGLVDNPYAANQVPLVINLPKGHVILFGASGWGKTTFLRSLVVSLAATHSPNQAHIYVLDLGGRNLTILNELPHVGSVIIPDEEGYEERVEQLLRELDAVVDERKTLLNNVGVPDVYRYNETHPDEPLPCILVAIDNFVEFRETFGSESDSVASVLDKFVELARQSKSYGIHFALTASRLNDLPNQMFNVFTERLTLKLTDPMEYRAIIGGGQVSDLAEIPGRGYIKLGRLPLSFQIAQPLDLDTSGEELGNENKELAELAQNMVDWIANSDRTYLEPIRVDALPKTILFKQILSRQLNLDLDEGFLDKLRAETRNQWADSKDPSKADWLRATLGVISGNRLREMHFEAKVDGVHGMIAGGTGSGKSELLMTLIVSLALKHDPSVLNFVLVDYKGGGAFKPFETMPHVVDSITNLNKAAVKRMFTAIDAEMQRRQKLNADTATKDIVEYREKGYHLTKGPYPHLFIIIDEYAEMITDNPEFKQELDSITRVGRAQGVNLLLASQRPTGVSDQMRANIKFRICLRVEGIDTSREMLRRSDAAFLPSGMPGRGYMQIGNENIELTQIAYTGESYPYAEVEEGGQKPKFYDVIVKLTQELAGENVPLTPWPPFLPTAMTFSEPLILEYMQSKDLELIQMGRQEEALVVNPFVEKWQKGEGAWYGVDWNKNAMRAVVGLLDDPYNAQLLPLNIDLTRGHVVLFGASGWGKTTFMRSLVMSLASTHSPNEFHAHLLDLGGRNLEVLREIPNVGTVIMPDERGYEERVQQLLRELNDIVDFRKRLFAEVGVSTFYEYNGSDDDVLEPAILIIIDNFNEFLESFGGDMQPDEDSVFSIFVNLLRQAKAYGLHFVISVDRLNTLSSKLLSLFTERLTLRLSDAQNYRTILGSDIGEIEEIPGRGYTKVGRQALGFQVALPPGAVDEQGRIRGEARLIRDYGKMMQDYAAASGEKFRQPLRIDALPKASFYRQVVSETYGFDPEKPYLEELYRVTKETWEHNLAAESADWLKVILGVASGNRNRELAMEAKKDGVHGMIAGGTGSGKSELLMTLICGLALNYDPNVLNFVLVDYKGGGAFVPFEKMPQVVDIVTNLNKSAVNRMFTAINAEMRRRQGLNAETGTKDIVEYRKKNLHLTHAPYPHLFVIIDEYSEMIDDNPEYRAELDSITRVGRAQGVNLILASQRPKGVSDQMRANIKLRLCLRVEEMDTSREMLRRPDAALLPNGIPGRGYLQIGNENLELLQVSWTGEKMPDDREAAVEWPEHEIIVPGDAEAEDEPRMFDQIVNVCSDLYNNEMARKPWPGFLPESFSLQSVLFDAQNNTSFTLTTTVNDWLNGEPAELWQGIDWREEAMRPVVGLLDNPFEARQNPLQFDLTRYHLVAFGDSGWGKTSFLRTVITSLAASHSPDELHAYILDLAGRNYGALEEYPHVGAIIYADEEAYEERLQRLLDKLVRLVEERQLLFSQVDAASLYEYNDRFPKEALPAVVVAIDNFAELRENHEMLVETTIIPLIRRSSSAGVAFIVTGNAPNAMPSKLYNLFGERITFKQGNPDRYMDIVGRGAIDIDDIPGRGYIRVGKRPLQFHIALPVGIFNEGDSRDTLQEGDELRLLGANMTEVVKADPKRWKHKAEPVDILPEIVPLLKLMEETPSSHRVNALMGENSSLQPALFDLRRAGPHFAVVGPPLSGKSTALYNWIFTLSLQYPPEKVQFVIFDVQRRFAEYGGDRTLMELPHVLDVAYELEDIERVSARLQAECLMMANLEKDKQKDIFVVIDNFDDFSDEISTNRNLPNDLAGLARRYGRDGLHFVIAGTLDGGISELKRRVLGSNFGIGLKNAQAIDTLRATKRPAALRGKELPTGRGFIVKSGQTTMIQVATPYDGLDVKIELVDPEDDEEKAVKARDVWMAKVLEVYDADQKVTWTDYDPSLAEGGEEGTGGVVDEEMQRVINLMRRIAIKGANGDKEAATINTNKSVLMTFVKSALTAESNLDASFFGTTDDDVINAAEGYFPEVSQNDSDNEKEKEKEKEKQNGSES